MKRLVLALSVLGLVAPLGAQSPLAVGRPVRATLARGDTARYRVDADSATIVRLSVDQVSVNAMLRVLGPKGTVVRCSRGWCSF